MTFCFLKALFLAVFAMLAVPAFADDDKGGAGGGQQQQQQQQQNQNQQQQKPDGVYLSKKEYDELMANQKKKDDPPSGGDDDDDLRKKAAKERADREKTQADAKTLESVIAFTMGLDDFVKKNADLLPNEIADIVKTASAENYDTATEKAAAVKRAMIESFFAVQANIESLTESQKRDLQDFLKLTKNGKEERAANVYAQIFEPCLEMNRRLKKAEELGRGRGSAPTSAESDYHKRLLEASNRKYGHK